MCDTCNKSICQCPDPVQLDAGSVFYHKGGCAESKLSFLKIENGTPIDEILEAIDSAISENVVYDYSTFELDGLRENYTIDSHRSFVEAVDDTLTALAKADADNYADITGQIGSLQASYNSIYYPKIDNQCCVSFNEDSTIIEVIQALVNDYCQRITTSPEEDTSPTIAATPTSSIGWVLSGTKNHTLQASLKISSEAGNALQLKSDGAFVATPTVTNQLQTLAFNTSTRMLTISSGNSIAIPAGSPQVLSLNTSTNILSLSGGGGTADLSTIIPTIPAETAIVTSNTTTVTLNSSGSYGHTLSAAVKVSANSGNAITVQSDGLHVATVTQTDLTTTDSNSVAFTTSGTAGHELSATVKISATGGNVISLETDGIYATETALAATDSSSIDFTLSGSYNHTITGVVKVSAIAGNAISINSDGLYVSTASSYSFNNGLTEATGVVKLGGTLLQNTTITANSFYLDVDPTTGGFRVNDTSTTAGYFVVRGDSAKTYGAIFGQETLLTNTTSSASASATSSLVLTQAGNFTHSSTNTFYAGSYGELGIDNSTYTLALGSGYAKAYSGIVGVFTVYASGDITGGMPAGGTFYANLGGSMNIQNVAALRTFGAVQVPGKPAYSGTVTNYYGLYMDATSDSSFTVTNRYGIYQAGTSDANHFRGSLNYYNGLNNLSDPRAKDKIADFTVGLAGLRTLSIVVYKYKESFVPGAKPRVGTYADQVEAIIPEAITRVNQFNIADLRMMDENALTYAAINAVIEVDDKVEDLKTKYETLKAEFDTYKESHP